MDVQLDGGRRQPSRLVGAENRELVPGQAREASIPSIPLNGTAAGNFAGDGVIARVLVNNQQIWPGKTWRTMNGTTPPMQIRTFRLTHNPEVWPGDNCLLSSNRFGTMDLRSTAFDPTIAYDDGEPTRLPKNSATNRRRTDGDINIAAESTFGNADLARLLRVSPAFASVARAASVA